MANAAPGDQEVTSLLSPQVPVLDGVGAIPPHRALPPGRHRADGAGQCQHQLAQWDFCGLRGTVGIWEGDTNPKGPCGHVLLMGTWLCNLLGAPESQEGCPGWSEPQHILLEVQRAVLPSHQLGCSLTPTGWEAVLV